MMIQEIISALGAMGWAVIAISAILAIGFLGVFVWFAKKIFDNFKNF